MFGKNSKRLQTIIGEDSAFKGELNVKETVRIDGFMEGNVRADWVIVGETGKIVGNIDSRGTVVGGTIEGNIDADEIVELKNKSRVFGEIQTGKLAVAEGAVFEGRSRLKKGKDSEDSADSNVTLIASSSLSS
jgi:cytoskeletal protein CcmA (bactofilin family)